MIWSLRQVFKIIFPFCRSWRLASQYQFENHSKFDGNVNHSAVFKAVLKQIAVLDRKTHRWKLRDQFKQ